MPLYDTAASAGASAPLALTGSTDAVQLTVKGNGTQTSDLTRVTDSGNAVLFRVTSSGNISAGGTTYCGAIRLLSNSNAAPTSGDIFLISASNTAGNFLSVTESGVAEYFRFSNGGDMILNASGSAPATNATKGFTFLPTMAGTPSGTPTRSFTGATPMVFDSSGLKLWAYTGGAWKSATFA